MYILQKLISIFVISLTVVFCFIASSVSDCPLDNVPCGNSLCCYTESSSCPEGFTPCVEDPYNCCPAHYSFKCAIPFTTNNDSVKCRLRTNTLSVIKCSVTEFTKVYENFQQIPSLQQLSDAFSRPCYDIPKCAKKFQCTKKTK